MMDFLRIEERGKRLLEQFPIVKRLCKRIYQRVSVTLSNDKFKSEGNVICISPVDDCEYYYGYYDKSPWDASDRYILALKVKKAYKSVAPKEAGSIGLIDTENGNRFIEIGITNSWNVQQGCMAQWLGPDFKTRVIYNDFRDGRYCSVIYNWQEKKEEKVFPMPIYDVARDGSYALSLDFSRLHRMRPGYGYSNLEEETRKELCPNKPCIWKIDICTGTISELFKYTDMASFQPNESMNGAAHKVNHLMISPSGKRFMVLHRWFKKGRKHTRLITVNIDKTEMYNLSDDVFVSHCYWKNDEEILSFLRKKGNGDHYYLMKDKTSEYKMYWPELKTDGHCSYSPDGRFIITDTYPNRKRIASVYLCTEEDNCSRRIARVFAPFRYDNDCRCDLHPRWNRKGDKICIDSVHNGKRGLYVIPIEITNIAIPEKKDTPMVSVIIPCYNATSTLPTTIKSLQQQTFKNFEVVLVDDGSKDNINEMVEQFKIDSEFNIVYVSQENSGVSSARNHGIELATGKYISFLDADDVYQRHFLERLVGVCETLNTDIVLSYQERDIEKVMNDLSVVTLAPEVSDINTFMNHFMYNKENIHFGGLLYRKDIIETTKIRFSLGTKYGEDLEFAWKYMINCKNGVILLDKLYGYYNNSESVVNTVRWEKTNLVDAMFRVQAYMEERNCSFVEQFTNYFLPRTVWTTAKTFAKGKRKDYYKKFLQEYPVKLCMKRLIKSSRNKMLKISAELFCVNKWVYYIAIGIVYKNR